MTMENSADHHVYPNLNSEAYRNLTDRSSLRDKQLQVLLINEDETIFLGASNMTDRYWNGTISIYNSLNFKFHEPLATKRTESGISDAISLGDNKFIVGEENGIIQVTELTTNEDTKAEELKLIGYSCLHDNFVLTLSAFNNKTTFVSGGMDNSIKIWDLELCVLHSYLPAHIDAVSCVATQPKSDHTFASCSWDGEALFWDIRNAKHAKELYTANVGLSALDWRPDNENILTIGHDDGTIKVIDIRNPNEILHKSQTFQRRIQQIKHNPEKTNLAAICADETTIKVMDNLDYAIVLEDNLHEDFVRSLAWHKNELFSCSWDNTVQRRSLESTE